MYTKIQAITMLQANRILDKGYYMNSQVLNRNILKKQLNVYPKKLASISDGSGWCTTGAVHTTKY